MFVVIAQYLPRGVRIYGEMLVLTMHSPLSLRTSFVLLLRCLLLFGAAARVLHILALPYRLLPLTITITPAIHMADEH